MSSIFRNLWSIRLHRRSSVFGTLARNYPPFCDSNQTKTYNMSWTFFITGGLIFGIYIYLTIWNIVYNSKKQREENYPTIEDLNRTDVVDMDGMGNFSRFPSSVPSPRTRPILRKHAIKEEVL